MTFFSAASKRLHHDLHSSNKVTEVGLDQDSGQFAAYVSYENLNTNTNFSVVKPQAQSKPGVNSSPKAHKRKTIVHQNVYGRKEKPFRSTDYIGKIEYN